VLIERGVLRAVTYDRATAVRAGAAPTGHGLPVPNIYGSFPTNLVMEGGATTLEDIIARTPRGILITRLWYNRLVDPADLIVTGLTRDGTFLIEDGHVTRGLRNYRINQSVRAMLNGITALSAPSRRETAWSLALRRRNSGLRGRNPRSPGGQPSQAFPASTTPAGRPVPGSGGRGPGSWSPASGALPRLPRRSPGPDRTLPPGTRSCHDLRVADRAPSARIRGRPPPRTERRLVGRIRRHHRRCPPR
jgi:hypothetical protein